jgi:hypothetical protein
MTLGWACRVGEWTSEDNKAGLRLGYAPGCGSIAYPLKSQMSLRQDDHLDLNSDLSSRRSAPPSAGRFVW